MSGKPIVSLMRHFVKIFLALSMVLFFQHVGGVTTMPSLWTLTTSTHADHKNVSCPEVVAPHTGSMDFVSKYKASDSGRDKLNQQALKKYHDSVSTIRALESTTVKYANSYLETSNPAYRLCVLDWLGSWAGSQAMLDPEANRTGIFVRKWALGSIALAALQISTDEKKLPVDVRDWIEQLTKQVIVDFDNRELKNHNNHDIWASWSVSIVAVLLDKPSYFKWAMNEWTLAIEKVDDGYLPKELSRKTRALEYHNYALQPLYFMADLACELGDSAYIGHPKLHLLIEKTAAGMVDNHIFEDKTGYKQNTSKLYTKTNMAWWRHYYARFKKYPESIERFVGSSHYATRLGGDLSLRDQPEGCQISDLVDVDGTAHGL